MLFLKMTCSACPEAYDVFDGNDEYLGYLRLRHGRFTAVVENGTVVYEAKMQNGDDGCFSSYHDRDYYLRFGLDAIARHFGRHNYRPQPPEVEYRFKADPSYRG
jgi:hypothetical protein